MFTRTRIPISPDVLYSHASHTRPINPSLCAFDPHCDGQSYITYMLPVAPQFRLLLCDMLTYVRISHGGRIIPVARCDITLIYCSVGNVFQYVAPFSNLSCRYHPLSCDMLKNDLYHIVCANFGKLQVMP